MKILRLSPPRVSKSVSHPKQALRDAKGSQEAAAMLLTHLQRLTLTYIVPEEASVVISCKSLD